MMILKHELKMNLKALLIWTVCIVGFDFCMILMYPNLEETLHAMADNAKSMGTFGEAFGMDQMNIATPIGFYATYIGTMLSICGGIFTAILGTGMLAKEEGSHTAEYLYTLPYTRRNIVMQKLAAIVVMVLAFDVANAFFGVLALQVIGANISILNILAYHVVQLLMHIEIACICFFISARTKKVNLGIGLGISLGLYFADMMCRVFEQIQGLKYITPYSYANATDIFGKKEADAVSILIGIGIIFVCILGANISYTKRDLTA